MKTINKEIILSTIKTMATLTAILPTIANADSISINGFNSNYKSGKEKEIRSLAHCVNQVNNSEENNIEGRFTDGKHTHTAIRSAAVNHAPTNNISYTFNKPIEVFGASVEHMQLTTIEYKGLALKQLTSIVSARAIPSIVTLLQFNNEYEVNQDKTVMYRHVGQNTLFLSKSSDSSIGYITCVFNTDQIPAEPVPAD